MGGGAAGASSTRKRKHPSCERWTGEHGKELENGDRVCFACEMEPQLGVDGKPRWRHWANAAHVERAGETWCRGLEEGKSRGVVKDNKEPTLKECLCQRRNCMFQLVETWEKEFAAHDEDERRSGLGSTCELCIGEQRLTQGSFGRMRTRMRRPGMYLHALRVLFSREDPARRGAIPAGSTLGANSTVCNACWLDGRRFALGSSSKGVRLTAREELELRTKSQQPQNDSLGGVRARTQETFLERLSEGKFVYLRDGMDIYQRERQAVKFSSLPEKSLREEVISTFRVLGDTISDVEFRQYSGAEVEAGDERRVFQYLMPHVVDHLEVAKLHEKLAAAEAKVSDAQEIMSELNVQSREKRQGEVGEQEAHVTREEDKRRKVELAAKIIREDIQWYGGWGNTGGRGQDKLGAFDVELPEALDYIQTSFPTSLAVFLSGVCGVRALPEGSGASEGETGTTNPGEKAKRVPHKANKKESVFMYMVGTMLGKAIRGTKDFWAPHDLKLSQAFKMRGMSEKNMAFLSSIYICCSDSVRYDREKELGRVDEATLLKDDEDYPISVAWDNNDTDPHAAISSAQHLSQIGACAHQIREAGGPKLQLESEWKDVKDVTVDMLLEGADGAAHAKAFEEWNDILFSFLEDSPHYLSKDGESQSCIEFKVLDRFTATPCKVASMNMFCRAGSTKSTADMVAALEQIQLTCHAFVEWSVDGSGNYRSTVKRRVLMEGDEETYRFMVQLKRGNPEKYKWMLPHPGGWHIMLHMTRALITKYYGAGIEIVAKALGSDDKHAAAGSKYRRSHHLLTVTYEAMWWAVIERYNEETGEGVSAAAAGAADGESSGASAQSASATSAPSDAAAPASDEPSSPPSALPVGESCVCLLQCLHVRLMNSPMRCLASSLSKY